MTQEQDKRHVLILGAGQIGMAVAQVLHERGGCRFSLHCRTRDGLRRAHAAAARTHLSVATASVGDLVEPEPDGPGIDAVIAGLRPDAVVDATNMATILSSRPDQQAAAHALAQYSTRLVQGAAAIGAPVVKISTTALGGMGLDIPFTHGDPAGGVLSARMWNKLFLSGIQLQVLWALARTYPRPGVHVVIPAGCVGFGEPEVVTLVEAVAVGEREGVRTLARDGQPLAPTVGVRAGEGPFYTRRELAVLADPGVMGAITAHEVAACVAGVLDGSERHDALSALAHASLRPGTRGRDELAATLSTLRAAERELNADPVVTGNLGTHVTLLLLELACLAATLGPDWADELRTGEPTALAERVARELPTQGRLLAEIVDRCLGLLDAHGTWHVEGAAGDAGTVELGATTLAWWGDLLRRYAPQATGDDALTRLLSVAAARYELRVRCGVTRQEEIA